MGNLLKFEFRKLFRQKSFYICGAILVGLIVLSTFTMNMLLNMNEAMAADGMAIEMAADASMFNGLYMLTTSLAGSDYSLVLSVFIALFVCADYTNGTLKNVLARGYGRISVYASKYIVSLIGATILAVFCWLAGFLSGTAFWGMGSFTADATAMKYVTLLLTQLLGVFAYTSLFFLIAVLLKKTGGAIAVGIILPLVIAMIIGMVDALLKKAEFVVADYWLDNCFGELTVIDVSSEIITRSVICFAIYAVVFVVGAHLIARRNEV